MPVSIVANEIFPDNEKSEVIILRIAPQSYVFLRTGQQILMLNAVETL